MSKVSQCLNELAITINGSDKSSLSEVTELSHKVTWRYCIVKLSCLVLVLKVLVFHDLSEIINYVRYRVRKLKAIYHSLRVIYGLHPLSDKLLNICNEVR